MEGSHKKLTFLLTFIKILKYFYCFVFQWMLFALFLSVSVYSVAWIVTALLGIEYEDCLTIAIKAICKNLGLMIFVLKAPKIGFNLSIINKLDIAPEIPSAILIMTSLVLLTHLLLKSIR